MRERWTDERLDDLNDKVDRGFERVEEELRIQRAETSELRKEMNARFDATNAAMNDRFDAMSTRFDAMNTRFDAMNTRFGALNRTLITAAVGLAVALIASRALPF